MSKLAETLSVLPKNTWLANGGAGPGTHVSNTCDHLATWRPHKLASAALVQVQQRAQRSGEPYLQHPHQHVAPVATLLLALRADAVHQVQQELAGHGLDAAGQGLIVDVLGKELDGEGEVTERQVLTDVMHKVGQRAVGEGPAGRDLC